MTVSSEKMVSGADGVPQWQRVDGTHVTLYAAPGALEASRASDTLRKAEAIVTALHKLLAPEAANSDEPISLYLTDSIPETSVASLSIASGGEERREPATGPDPAETSRAIYSSGDGEPLARAITAHLLRQWFGANVASVPMFVEGIAGMAAAQTGIGSSLEDVDQQVRTQVGEGKTVALAIQPQLKPKSEETSCIVIDPVATSFLAFLIANSGASALQRYLKAYDPERQDQAAMEAYRHPLAVLEEDWLARVRRKPDDGSLLRSFLHQILPLLKPYKWKQIEILVYLLLAAGYNVVQPYAIKIVIDRLTAQVRQNHGVVAAGPLFVQTLGPFILLLLGINVVNGIVSLRRAYTVNYHGATER
jgi:hypothetical protein